MNISSIVRGFSSIIRGFAVAALLCSGYTVSAQDAPQKTFTSPEDAVVALVEAADASDSNELRALFGPDGDKILFSGDPVEDERNREVFLVAYTEQAGLMAASPTSRILYVGYEDWPFPIPLVKDGQAWRFDTAAGAEEILVRRIGRNELSTIGVCQIYVAAQKEYAAGSHDSQSVGAYAQRMASSPGRHDGLYWRSEDPEELSPLGRLAAEAAAEGYRPPQGQPAPFHGYLFHILTGEGSKSDGRSYIVNGQMRGGFALIAYPAAYGVSGVMSFIVNQDGVVYQQDLGPKTAAVAADISRYDPASGWTEVQ
jgi:hypothetical protein